MTITVGIRCDAGPRTGVGHLVRCVLSVLRFEQGRWKSIEVDIAAPAR